MKRIGYFQSYLSPCLTLGVLGSESIDYDFQSYLSPCLTQMDAFANTAHYLAFNPTLVRV